MYSVIELLYKFKQYQPFSRGQIFKNLIPFFNSGQFKVFYEKEKAIGFVSWAFLDDEGEDIYRNQAKIPNYNCGDNAWVIHLVSLRNAKPEMDWIKKYFSKELGGKKKVKYFRAKNNFIVSEKYQLTKEFYK